MYQSMGFPRTVPTVLFVHPSVCALYGNKEFDRVAKDIWTIRLSSQEDLRREFFRITNKEGKESSECCLLIPHFTAGESTRSLIALAQELQIECQEIWSAEHLAHLLQQADHVLHEHEHHGLQLAGC